MVSVSSLVLTLASLSLLLISVTMREHPIRNTLLLSFALLLSACAGGPKFSTEDIDTTLTPKQAVSEAASQKGKGVLWGGMIINSTNLEKETRIEVLAYPLDSDHYPQTDMAPYGRFLLFRDGYLETVDYAPGRLVSLVGRFDGTVNGKVGESEYTYPLIRAEQLHLWSKGGRRSPNVHFGIGVIFSN